MALLSGRLNGHTFLLPSIGLTRLSDLIYFFTRIFFWMKRQSIKPVSHAKFPTQSSEETCETQRIKAMYERQAGRWQYESALI